MKVFNQSIAGIAVFLRHLWSTDGCVHLSEGVGHYANVYYASSSEQLAKDVQRLLLRLGINGTLSRRSQGTKGRDQYHVHISGRHEILSFLTIVGVLGQNKTLHKAAILSYLSSRSSKTNRDVIPASVWQLHALPAMRASGVSSRALHEAIGNSY